MTTTGNRRVIRPVLFGMPGYLAERVVMDQGNGFFVGPEYQDRALPKPVPPLADYIGMHSQLLHSGRVIEASGDPKNVVVRLNLDRKMMLSFPERSKEARSSFRRFFRDIAHETVWEGKLDTPAIRLQAAIGLGVFLTLDNKICKRLYRPLSAREAAGFLGVDKKSFRRLRDDFEIAACERIRASRHGRSYSYPVFSVSDVIRLQSMIPSPCISGGEVAV